ncbi:hypothetical protein BH23CHL2_BH23CHL2_03690 [soil metagenome]
MAALSIEHGVLDLSDDEKADLAGRIANRIT